jgi:hypothetical protein
MWAIALMLFLLGIIFMIIAPINKRKNRRCSAQTQGRLMKRFETENSNSRTGHAYIYSYSVDGIEYKLRSTVRCPETDKVGDTGTIWYNPKNPKDAQTFRYESDKVYKIIFLIGVVMLLLGLILFVVSVGMS